MQRYKNKQRACKKQPVQTKKSFHQQFPNFLIIQLLWNIKYVVGLEITFQDTHV